ncbi:MAG TPA: DDE-type integrase/transposase/recombinase, partial [Ktedonobacteraceae bacterium]
MPKRRYERREPSHEWQQIQPLLKDPAQIQYEIIRPVVLWGQTPQERGAETGVSPRTIYYRANLFDQAGMASLLPAAPLPEIPRQDKRALPPDMRQEIVDLHMQYPAFRPHELATICFVKFNRKPAPATIKLILASGPTPSTTERRYPRYADIEDGAERRRTIIRLHADGWNAKSIASYLEVSRQTVHLTLRRWAQEQFAAVQEKSHARTGVRKVDLKAVQEVKKLSENPLIGAYRVSAALEQMGIHLSRATCGRLLALHRDLYHLQVPRKLRPKAEMPFRAARRHEMWSVDIRYLDMHTLKGVEMVYCISILENFSRAILASAISLRQDNEAFFAVFYTAIRKHGIPEILVSDNGSVFISHATRRVCEQLGIEKKEIKK